MTGRIALVGADHNHLYEIIDRMVKAGAEAVAHTSEGQFIEHYSGWQADSVERTYDDILADDSIDLIVTAAIPNRRQPLRTCGS